MTKNIKPKRIWARKIDNLDKKNIESLFNLILKEIQIQIMNYVLLPNTWTKGKRLIAFINHLSWRNAIRILFWWRIKWFNFLEIISTVFITNWNFQTVRFNFHFYVTILKKYLCIYIEACIKNANETLFITLGKKSPSVRI